MKKILAIIIVFLFLGCNFGSSESTPDEKIAETGKEDFCVFTHDALTLPDFVDADKEWDGNDDYLCWAATSANMLTWAGYATDEDDTFNIFKRHFDDKPGYVTNAINYYFDQYLNRDPDKLLVRADGDAIMDFIVCAVDADRIVSLSMDWRADSDSDSSHVITVYGYEIIDDDHVKLVVADGDDGEHQLVTREYYLSNKGIWQNTNWRLIYAISLK